MKKILFTLLSLLCVTSAWAGEGDGTKEHPYTGEWEATEFCPNLKKGDYLAFGCVINGYVTIQDIRLDQNVALIWAAWSPGNLIDDPKTGPYVQYGKDNPPANRKGQSFIVQNVSRNDESQYKEYVITGYFSGFYTTPDADGFVYVESAEQMRIILQGNSNVAANTQAKIRLTDDIYLTDVAVKPFCDTFTGTLDGDGHTIYGSRDGTRQNKTHLFTISDGATFQNLNFYNIRVDNREEHNVAVITSKAKNGCVFENITFDKISTYVGDDRDNTSAAAAYATTNCIFKNITVKNSDFTADNSQSGAVVGHAMNCSFDNIKVVHCESTARDYKSGGVAGRTDYCTISNIEILDSYIKAEGIGGGVVGESTNSVFTNCTVDDQTCVRVNYYAVTNDIKFEGTTVKGERWGFAGGIVGRSDKDKIYTCINSALITCNDYYAGGIVGRSADGGVIEGCLNTGLIITTHKDNVEGGIRNKYKTKSDMTCVTKTYQGKEYVIRQYNGGYNEQDDCGGIIGSMINGKVAKCVNFGSIASKGESGGITGFIENTEISDCLSDFSSCYEYTRGISGWAKESSSINNCLNLTTYKDYYNYNNQSVSGGNNYSLTTVDVQAITNTTDGELASGKICHRLGENWEQNLGTDAYPTLGNKGIYHTRNVSNQYGTVCLPYPVQSDENISYYTFSEVYNDYGEVLLTFDYADGKIPAGTPLLFRVRNTGEHYFSNVATDNNDWTDDPIEPENQSEIWWQSWNFVGTFGKLDVADRAKYTYYLSDGVIKNAKTVTIPAFRAYFIGPDIETLTGNGSNAARVRIVIDGEENEAAALQLVTDDSLSTREGRGEAYTLFGTMAGQNYRGIVVRDGKKMLSL